MNPQADNDQFLQRGSEYLRLREQQVLPSSWLNTSEEKRLLHLQKRLGLAVTTWLEDRHKKMRGDDTKKFHGDRDRDYDPFNEVLTPRQEAQEADRHTKAAHEFSSFHDSYTTVLGLEAARESYFYQSHIYQSQQEIDNILAAVERIPDFQVQVAASSIQSRISGLSSESPEEDSIYSVSTEKEMLELLDAFPDFEPQSKSIGNNGCSPTQRQRIHEIPSFRKEAELIEPRWTMGEDRAIPKQGSGAFSGERVKISVPATGQSVSNRNTGSSYETSEIAQLNSTAKVKRPSKPLKSTHKVSSVKSERVVENHLSQPALNLSTAGMVPGGYQETRRPFASHSLSFPLSPSPQQPRKDSVQNNLGHNNLVHNSLALPAPKPHHRQYHQPPQPSGPFSGSNQYSNAHNGFSPSFSSTPTGLSGTTPVYQGVSNNVDNRGSRLNSSFSEQRRPIVNPRTPPMIHQRTRSQISDRQSFTSRNQPYQPEISPTSGRGQRETFRRTGRGISRAPQVQNRHNRSNLRATGPPPVDNSPIPFKLNVASSLEFASISFMSRPDRDDAVALIKDSILRNPALAALTVVQPHLDDLSLKVSGPLHQNLRGKLGILFHPSTIRASMN